MTEVINILLIEDNPGDVRLIREILAEDPAIAFRLENVMRLADGIERLVRDHIEVILLDLGLPDSQGLDTFHALRRKAPDVPIVVLSGIDDESVALTAMREGAQDYLVKGQVSGGALARSLRYAVERARAAQALRESRRLNQLLADNISDVVWTTDIDFNFVYVSPSIEQFIGYTPAEVLSKRAKDIMTPESHARAVQEMRKALALLDSGTAPLDYSRTLELEHIRKDGSHVWAEVKVAFLRDKDKQRIGQVGVTRDITERRRNEDERVRLMAAIEQVADAIFITDGNGVIQYVNPAFERVSGYSQAEAAGQNPRLLKSGKNDPELYRGLWETITGGKVWRGHLSNRRKDETFYEVDAVISPILDSAGNLVNFVSVQRDVTQEVSLEQQLRQAQKMEAIGLLAGGVAHDFNNLLTVIKGYAELLQDKLAEMGVGLTDLDHIEHAADSAARLTRQLLTIARKQILEPVILGLNVEVQELEKMMRRVIGEDIELYTALAPDLGKVKADPGQVEQIILNLVVNARDAMPQGGVLTISTQNVELTQTYAKECVVVAPGPYVMLSITDTGCGMDAETRSRIFDPFFTTKEMGKGTGLGLATVYGILKQSGGYIWVYSDPGQGATFNVYLPRVEDSASPGPRHAEEDARSVSGTETLLLVEDDVMIRGVAVRVLRSCGYTVLEAANGAVALDLFREHTGPIHLIISDVIMPKMSGPEMVRKVLERAPQIKVLYVSGHTDRALVHNGVFQPGSAFLLKPFAPSALLRKVREVLDSPGPG